MRKSYTPSDGLSMYEDVQKNHLKDLLLEDLVSKSMQAEEGDIGSSRNQKEDSKLLDMFSHTSNSQRDEKFETFGYEKV
jgi:hypothetical protein